MADEGAGGQGGGGEGAHILQEQDGDDGDHLGDGFGLAPIVGGDDPALLHRQEADGGDGELPEHDEDDAHRGGQVQPDQADEGGHHQYFIGQGVHELAKVGDKMVPAGDLAV